MHKTVDRLFLTFENGIQMGKSKDIEDVEDGFVHAAHPNVAVVIPNRIDKTHDHAQSRAGYIGQALAIDYDL